MILTLIVQFKYEYIVPKFLVLLLVLSAFLTGHLRGQTFTKAPSTSASRRLYVTGKRHLQIIVYIGHVGAVPQGCFVRVFSLQRATVRIQHIRQVTPSYTHAHTHRHWLAAIFQVNLSEAVARSFSSPIYSEWESHRIIGPGFCMSTCRSVE